MDFVFASNNKNKIAEIEKLLPSFIKIKSLKDIGCLEDIAETGHTFEENALIKAGYIYNNFHYNAFADDSGLEVLALNNKPGVYSARYAGEQKSDIDNIRKLLNELKNSEHRKAQFRTVIALIIDKKEYLFEGVIKGKITKEMRGEGGFGYDPVFIPEGFSKTFAEMSMDEKNKISHRAIATNKLVDFLKSL